MTPDAGKIRTSHTERRITMSQLERIQNAMERAGLAALLLMDDRNIYYATGFMPTDSAALITPGRAWLVTDSRYIEDAQRKCVKGVEVLLASVKSPLGATLKALSADIRGEIGAEEDKLTYGLYTQMESLLGRSFAAAGALVQSLRAHKSADELDRLIAAQRIAEKALEETLPLIKPGLAERELAAELTYRMMRHGSERNSFDPIAITGAHTSMPHGVPGQALIQSGDFVTMDFGCVHEGYCSDMTRTVAVGSATDEMKNVYDTVLRAQLAGIAAAKPSATGAEVHGAAAQVIADAGYGEYFGHGFGHGVGLDIHESPNASPRNASPLGEGAVISAEPGIYIPGKFGVRIEDVLYLTGDGNVDITRAPKELIIL